VTWGEEFWERVIPGPGGCWGWSGSHLDGYGQHRRKVDGVRRTVAAHRAAYEMLIGEIPEGLELDHLCRNRGCVNPYHLDPVTHAVNALRSPLMGKANSRKTHCPAGHEFTAENTRFTSQSGNRPGLARICRTCERGKAREYRARRKRISS